MFWKKAKSLLVINPEALSQAIDEMRAPVIVDIRGAAQFRNRRLPGAINIPLEELEGRAGELDPAAPTVFY
ncbi:MAG: rhodanese-like domain-containing protein [Blastocatellales bacterium]